MSHHARFQPISRLTNYVCRSACGTCRCAKTQLVTGRDSCNLQRQAFSMCTLARDFCCNKHHHLYCFFQLLPPLHYKQTSNRFARASNSYIPCHAFGVLLASSTSGLPLTTIQLGGSTRSRMTLIVGLHLQGPLSADLLALSFGHLETIAREMR